MQKIIYLTFTLLVTSCANVNTYSQLDNYTQQNVKNISLLKPGMKKENVIKIMGNPAKVEFSGTNKALHYCNTGYGSDEYAVVILSSDKVVAAKNYTITLSETGGAKGDCSRFVKSIDLDKAESVHEIRFR